MKHNMKDNLNLLANKSVSSDFNKIKKWFEKKISALEKLEKIKAEQISIVITDDKNIKYLNQKYRQQNKITDVLSFAQCDIKEDFKTAEDNFLGEIFINFRQAQRQFNNIQEELIKLLVHGYLHTRGYLHDTKKQREAMDLRAEKIILNL